MTTTPLQHPLTLPCGAVLPNRIAKAAMTSVPGASPSMPSVRLTALLVPITTTMTRIMCGTPP